MGGRKCQIHVQPDGGTIEVDEGTSLLDALTDLGVKLDTVCGGSGTCGRCIVQIVGGEVPQQRGVSAHITRKQQAAGFVQACQTPVVGDLEIVVPSSSRLDSGQLLKKTSALEETEIVPPVRSVALEVTPPTLVDNQSDLTRIVAALTSAGIRNLNVPLGVVRRMSSSLRTGNFHVEALITEPDHLVDVVPVGTKTRHLGAAIDLGTTTVVVELVDLDTGRSLWLDGDYNGQGRYGADVITRIVHAQENENGLEELQKAVLTTINTLLTAGLKTIDAQPEQVLAAAVAGNTTMIHLFLGLPANQIRIEPYIPVAAAPPPVSAREISLGIHPDALVYCIPGVASYVGGDITAGAIATGIDQSEELTLFLDIGTNGEMVLGNSDWLLCCACSAGPAFEGVGLRDGMRAVQGAIDSVTWSRERGWKYRTIANRRPRGICGSGLIDLISALWTSGVIDRSGHMHRDADPQRVRYGDDGIEFVLVPEGKGDEGREIAITEADIRTLLRSKAAVFAGLQVMLNHVGMTPEFIDRVLVAGGFGNYLDVDQAITIGLLPDVPRDRIRFVGNSSLTGARAYLLSDRARERATQLARSMTYLELSIGNDFMEEFTKALFLPHTDLEHFPTVNVVGR